VRLTGDEPHYLVAALALGRFHTVQVAAAYRDAFAHGTFGPWGPHPLEQAVVRSGGTYPAHALGLPLLLALPVALAGVGGAEVALALLVGALAAWLLAWVAELAPGGPAWRLAPVVLFLSPAFLLASTQVYPDLLSGMAIAVVAVALVGMERGRAPGARMVPVAGLLAFLPWLHTQNLAATVVLGAALVVVHRRRGLPWRPLLVALGLVVCSWAGLAAVNLSLFGHPLGLPETFTWGPPTGTRLLALVVDRQQGLVVQFPAAMIGLATLWAGRRRRPVLSGAVVLVVGAVLIVSAALSDSFGGTSFVGRFQWSVAPVLLALAALFILEVRPRRPALAAGTLAALGALAVAQWVPVLLGNHPYYSFVAEGGSAPGAGWWGPVDGLIPSFNELTRAWGDPRLPWSLGLVGLVLVAGVGLAAAVGSGSGRRALAGALVLGLGTFGLAGAAAARPPQLMAARTFPAAALPSLTGTAREGARSVAGTAEHGAVVFGPGWSFPTGRYRAVLTYRLEDPAADAAPVDVLVQAAAPSRAGRVVRRAELAPGRTRQVFDVTLGPGQRLFVRVFWEGTGRLSVRALTLTQVASG
jgi:hypothetical protein